jgi:chromate transporter
VTGAARTAKLVELARLFLKLGVVGFGGPAAHIAMMEDEVVRRRRWLSREDFLDLLGATNLIPGPNSTEMAIHIGRLRAGWPGLMVAGLCFILPAAVIVGLISYAYVELGALPETAGVLRGVKPVVIVIMLQALWGLARTAVTSVRLAVIGFGALVATAMGVNELLSLAGAGLLAMILRANGGRDARTAHAAWAAAPLSVASARAAAGAVVGGTAAAGAGAATFTLGALFLTFLKIGSVLFGSGYVLFAFLRADLVQRLGWLSERQLLDAVAVGQVTPGPVFTAATFIGYLLGGVGGAAVATAAIFLPAFVLVAASGPLVPWLRRTPAAAAALDGVIVASLALLVSVAWHLGWAAIVDLPTVLIAAASAVLLVRYRIGSALLVLGGGVVGLGSTLLRG